MGCPPDQDPTSPRLPAWNTAQGGADFGYTISGVDLTQPTTAALYWSADTNFDPTQDTLIAGSVTTTQTAASPDPYPIHVDAASLGTPPAGARYLLAVVDPDNTVAESDEPNYPNDFGANNVQFLAYDPITMDSATSPDSKSVSFTYDVSEADPGQPITVAIYRSASSSFDPNAAILVNEMTVPALDSAGGDSEAIGSHNIVMQDPDALHPIHFTNTSSWSPTPTTISVTLVALSTRRIIGSSSSESSSTAACPWEVWPACRAGRPTWLRRSKLTTVSIMSFPSIGPRRPTSRSAA